MITKYVIKWTDKYSNKEEKTVSSLAAVDKFCDTIYLNGGHMTQIYCKNYKIKTIYKGDKE